MKDTATKEHLQTGASRPGSCTASIIARMLPASGFPIASGVASCPRGALASPSPLVQTEHSAVVASVEPAAAESAGGYGRSVQFQACGLDLEDTREDTTEPHLLLPPNDTLLIMRRAVALQCCTALVCAFVLAPFQHVHRGEDFDGHHEHAQLVHTHLYAHDHSHVHIDKPGEQEIENPDDDQASPLDTFTLDVTADFAPFIPARAPAIIGPSAEARESFELIKARGHDPPPGRNSSPRAPPL